MEKKLKTTKVEKVVVDTYQKIEDGVVGAYQKVEDTVVGAYKKLKTNLLIPSSKTKSNLFYTQNLLITLVSRLFFSLVCHIYNIR